MFKNGVKMKKLASIALIGLIGMSSSVAFAQLSDKEEQEYENVPSIIATDDGQQKQATQKEQESNNDDKYPQDHLTEKDNTK